MQRDETLAMLRRFLEPDEVARVSDAVLSAVRLRATAAHPDELTLGASRFGGHPDLPAGFEWPRRNGRPLAFLAQLNFADFRGWEGMECLPADGRSCFFYDTLDQPWGYDPAHRAGWSVVQVPEDVPALRPTATPAPTADAEPGRLAGTRTDFRRCRIVAEPTVCVPDLTEYAELQMQDAEGLDDVFDALQEAGNCIGHQLLGHPGLVQGDMRLECQLVSHGLHCGSPTGYRDPRAAALTAGRYDWQLLLQSDSDENGPGWMWGDSGRLYFWIRKDDLAKRAFDQVWTVLQCY